MGAFRRDTKTRVFVVEIIIWHGSAAIHCNLTTLYSTIQEKASLVKTTLRQAAGENKLAIVISARSLQCSSPYRPPR